MSDKKKSHWDGRSRISTKQYKDNYNEIFKKEKKITKNNSKPSDSVKKPGVSTNLQEDYIETLKKLGKEYERRPKNGRGLNLQINAEVVNGTCPHCQHQTVLVSVWTNCIYRCMTCGFDVKQMVNGKISYIPHVEDPKKFKYGMKIDNPNG